MPNALISARIMVKTCMKTYINYIRFEVFTAVTMKNDAFWDVTPWGSCKNRRFGRTITSIIRVTGIGELGTTLAVTSNRTCCEEILACFGCQSLLTLFLARRFVTLMMEVIWSSETSVLTRAPRRNVPEGGILIYFNYTPDKLRSTFN
jgi:hypothetical protein